MERFRLQFSRKDARIETGAPCRHALVLRYGDLAPLLLADCSAEEMLSTGRMRGTTAAARRAAKAIFPAARWWRPPLDDLLA